MKRRQFLYLSGVGGAGLVVMGSRVSEAGEASIVGTDGVLLGPAEDFGIKPETVSSTRVVLPAGSSISLSGDGTEDLRYTAYLEGASSLDVVGGSARLTVPTTKSLNNFKNQLNDLVFEVPTAGAQLHNSEMIVYTDDQAERLQRPSAENTFMFVATNDERWHVIHIAEATTEQVTLDVLATTLPSAQPAALS